MYASTLSTADEKLIPEIFLKKMGSVTHYLKSLTLPMLSYFSGSNFVSFHPFNVPFNINTCTNIFIIFLILPSSSPFFFHFFLFFLVLPSSFVLLPSSNIFLFLYRLSSFTIFSSFYHCSIFFLPKKITITYLQSTTAPLSTTKPLYNNLLRLPKNDLLQTCFGDAQIEDLWIRFFCCSTNVTDRRLEVHDVGPLWRYLRASMSVLGLLPPMPDHDDSSTMLVDGGYVNNLPFDVMESLRDPGVIIVVDVENWDDTSSKIHHIEGGEHVSGWWLLCRQIWSVLGFGPSVKLPSSSQIVLEITGIAHYERYGSKIEK